MKKIILVILTLSLLSSCKKNLEDFNKISDWNTYNIKAGHHNSTSVDNIIHVEGFDKKELSFLVRFDNTAIYNLNNNNQGDINKLYGFSDCGCKHHVNSARIGWNYDINTNLVRLYAYVYKDTKMSFKYITSVNMDQDYKCTIICDNSEYVFIVDSVVIKMNRGCDNNSIFRYYLYPYFGGDEVAPHDVKIKIFEFI